MVYAQLPYTIDERLRPFRLFGNVEKLNVVTTDCDYVPTSSS